MDCIWQHQQRFKNSLSTQSSGKISHWENIQFSLIKISPKSQTYLDMLAELYLPCEMPEPPKESFLQASFKGLFGGGAKSIDREELCKFSPFINHSMAKLKLNKFSTHSWWDGEWKAKSISCQTHCWSKCKYSRTWYACNIGIEWSESCSHVNGWTWRQIESFRRECWENVKWSTTI